MESVGNWILNNIHIFILSALIIWLCTRIRPTGQSGRIVVVTLGTFNKLLGPGIFVKLSGSETIWEPLELGQIGSYIGDDLAQFGRSAIPVVYNTKPDHGVKLESFENNSIWVAPCSTRIVKCQKCGHDNVIAE